MKIIIYSVNFAPEPTGIGKYTGEMAEWLATHGHRIRVVTAPPYYPKWRISPGYSPWRYVRKVLYPQPHLKQKQIHRNGGSLTLYRCPIWVPANLSALKRIFHLASFALSSVPIMLSQSFWKPDIVWVVEPALFCTPIALITARLSGAKSWLHIQDFEVDAAFSLGILNSEKIQQIAVKMEKWLTGRFDLVSSISIRMVERIWEKSIPEAQTRLFPNWVDVSKIYPLSGPSPFRSVLEINSNTCVVLYSGNLGAKQGLEILIEAARRLVGTDIVLIICGTGGIRNSLVRSAHGLSNVKFLDLQPQNRLNDLLNLADIHVLPQRPDVADLVMPSKLSGMLASGRPVIATANPQTEISNILKTCGITTSPGNIQELSNAIAELAVDDSRRRSLGKAARRYVLDHWKNDTVLKRFEEQLIELVRNT